MCTFFQMDFKIAGTRTGITAEQVSNRLYIINLTFSLLSLFQLTLLKADFKIAGLPFELIAEVMEKSRLARHDILDIMDKQIASPRLIKKKNQPILKTISTSVDKRSKLVGVGGINIKKIFAKTGVTLTQIDEASFRLFAPNQTCLTEAEQMIDRLLDTQVYPCDFLC